MSDGEFFVYQEFEDGFRECVHSLVDGETAVNTAKHCIESVAGQCGITRRVIITDGGDFTCFEWKYGEGVTFPSREDLQKARQEGAAP